MKDVTLNQREQARLQVLNNVLEYQLPTTQATEVLGISERQIRRVLAAYRREGAAALVHGNRGRQPRNAVNEDVATAVVILASGKYAGFNHSHLTEVLAEREGIHLSRQTVSRLLNRHGLPSARRHRPPKHRVRRERMPQEGMLLQIDGSHHPWLEERGPRFALLLAVDDATGTVAGAVFQPEEDTRGYFLLMEGIIRRYGIPLALYGDRHGVFKFSGKPRHIQPPVEATHFCPAASGGRRTPQARYSAAQGGFPAQAGPVESRPPRQAARCLPEGHRQATGYFQKHGQEVRRLASSPHQPDSWTDYPISNSAPYQRTFSLSTWADIFAGQRHD